MGRRTGRPRGHHSRAQDDTAHLLLCDRVGRGGQRPGGARISRGGQQRRNGATSCGSRIPEKLDLPIFPKPRQPPSDPGCPRRWVGPIQSSTSIWEKSHFPHSEVQGQGVGVRRLCGEAVRLRWLPNKSETSRSRLTIEGQPKLSSSALFLLPPHAPRPPQQHACDRLMHESTPANGPQVHLWGMSGCPQRKGG